MPINMQGWEWVILIVLALLIFGGSRLAGAGKNAGRALREFKDETRQIKADDEKWRAQNPQVAGTGATAAGDRVVADERVADDRVVDAELVERPERRDQA